MFHLIRLNCKSRHLLVYKFRLHLERYFLRPWRSVSMVENSIICLVDSVNILDFSCISEDVVASWLVGFESWSGTVCCVLG